MRLESNFRGRILGFGDHQARITHYTLEDQVVMENLMMNKIPKDPFPS
jgi:hypothetical protein